MRQIRFKLKEKESYQYIYVDNDNKVHIFLPLSRIAGNITLDNTCRATDQLQELILVRKGGITKFVDQYITDLEADLAVLPANGRLYQEKQSRLTQLQSYRNLLTNLQFESSVENSNHYPKAIETLMASNNSNCGLMFFCPPTLDRSVSIAPNSDAVMFSFSRGVDTGFAYQLNQQSNLYHAQHQLMPSIIAAIKTRYNEKRTQKNVVQSNQDSTELATIIRTVFAERGYSKAEAMQFVYTADNVDGLNYDYEMWRMLEYYDPGTPCSLDEFLNNMIERAQASIDNFAIEINASPFLTLAAGDTRKISLLIQFLIGIAGVDYCEHLNVRENLGQNIETLSAGAKTAWIVQITQALATSTLEGGILDILVQHQPLHVQENLGRNIRALSAEAKTELITQITQALATDTPEDLILDILARYQSQREDLGQNIEALSAGAKTALIARIVAALATGAPEDGILNALAQHQPPLVQNPAYFSDERNRSRIKTKFCHKWKTIHTDRTPHYDDFIVLMEDKENGCFVKVASNLCVHLSHYCQAYVNINNPVSTNNAKLHRDYFAGANPRLASPTYSDAAFVQGLSNKEGEADASGLITIGQLLEKEPAMIANFLAMDSIEVRNKHVFETLTLEECQMIKSSRKWSGIQPLMAGIFTAQASKKYPEYGTSSDNVTIRIQANQPRRHRYIGVCNQKLNCYFGDNNSAIVITTAQEKALYAEYGALYSFDTLHGQNRQNKLCTILTRVVRVGQPHEIEPYQIIERNDGQLVVILTQQQAAQRQALEAQLPRILENHTRQMLITKDMAASFANFGGGNHAVGTVIEIIAVLRQIFNDKQFLNAENPTTPDAIIVTMNADNRGFTLKCNHQTIMAEVKDRVTTMYQGYCRHTFSKQEVYCLVAKARGLSAVKASMVSEQSIKKALESLGIDYVGNIELLDDGQCRMSIPEYGMKKVVEVLIQARINLLAPKIQKLEKEYSDFVAAEVKRSEPPDVAEALRVEIGRLEPTRVDKSKTVDMLAQEWTNSIINFVDALACYNSIKEEIESLESRITAVKTKVDSVKAGRGIPSEIVQDGFIELDTESESEEEEVTPSPPSPGFTFPPILKSILLSAAVGLGCSALAMGIVVPSILGLTGPITPIYATVIGGMILGIGMGILYASNEKDLNGRVLVFGTFGPLGHTVFVSCLGSGLLELVPYLASTGLAPEMATGILIGGTFGITVICDMLAYTLLKQNDVQLFA